MHELARMAEARQAEARLQVEALLAERSQLLEAAGEAAEVGTDFAKQGSARNLKDPRLSLK